MCGVESMSSNGGTWPLPPGARDQALGEDAGEVLRQTLAHLGVLLGDVEREDALDGLRRVDRCGAST
jgi:hypothetical protein